MNDQFPENKLRAMVGDDRIPYDIQEWMPDEAILTEHCTAYHISAGMPVCSIACILCDRPALGNLIVMITMALPEFCRRGAPHLVCTTVVRHLECEMPEGQEMASLIWLKVGQHFG